MKTAYKQFKSLKNEDRSNKIKERSVLTLEWYEKIGTLLDDESYEYSHEFLRSVCEFIETKEYITDGQIQGVQNIIDGHQNYGYSNYGGQPF